MFFLLPFLWLNFYSSKPVAPAIIAPETSNIIITTSDGGAIWHDLTASVPPNKGGMILESIDDQMYLGVGDDLYTSLNSNIIKWKKEASFNTGVILGLFPGKKGPYAITLQKGFFQQNEDGNWEPVFQSMNDKIVFSFLETADESLLASTDSGIYKTSDNGQTWKRVLLNGSIQSLIGDKDVYLVTSKEGIWRSTDEGEHWTHALTTPTYTTSITPFENGFIAIVMGQEFGGIRTTNEMYASGDLGATWEKMEVPAELDNVFEVKQAGMILMASGERGIFSSSDQGNTWKFVHEAPDNKNKFYTLISSGNTIFALLIQGC